MQNEVIPEEKFVSVCRSLNDVGRRSAYEDEFNEKDDRGGSAVRSFRLEFETGYTIRELVRLGKVQPESSGGNIYRKSKLNQHLSLASNAPCQT